MNNLHLIFVSTEQVDFRLTVCEEKEREKAEHYSFTLPTQINNRALGVPYLFIAEDTTSLLMSNCTKVTMPGLIDSSGGWRAGLRDSFYQSTGLGGRRKVTDCDALS